MTNERSLTTDLTFTFGDRSDGVIGIPLNTRDGHIIEASYFFGTEKPKNIIVISSQAGCPMRCTFCELGSEAFARNLKPQEIVDQVQIVLALAERLNFSLDGTAHKVTIANSGEPLLNPDLVEGLEQIARSPLSFKLSTIFPAGPKVSQNWERFTDWARASQATVQPQISLISTSENQRQQMDGARLARFDAIRQAAEVWYRQNPQGRMINLSLILTQEMICEPKAILNHLPPALFRIRLRDYVPTVHGERSLLRTKSVPQREEIAQQFQDAGYHISLDGMPTPIERKFGLAGNVIRRMYLDLLQTPH